LDAEGETGQAAPAASGDAPRGAQRLLTAAALYFCMVFVVGALLGPLRVLWLEPFVGPALAVLCEAPLLILAMRLAARWAPAWAHFQGSQLGYLAMGFVALILQQIADLAVAFGLRAMTFDAQLRYFSTPAGWIYAACLAAFAFMPLVASWKKRGAPALSGSRPPNQL
jgi:hypothetical protein